MIIFLTLINSIFMVTGQILWKFGVRGKTIDQFTDLLRLFLNPFILLGILTYVLATGLWIYILNKGDLSYVYPIQSVAFIFALFAGVFLFHEQFSVNKALGIAIIIIGVIVLTRK